MIIHTQSITKIFLPSELPLDPRHDWRGINHTKMKGGIKK